MTKENLWQVIIGMLVTAIFGVLLPMKWAAIFPAFLVAIIWAGIKQTSGCLLYTSPCPRDRTRSRMPSSA